MRVLPSYIARAFVLWLLVRLALLGVGSAGAGFAGEAAGPASKLTLAPPAMLLAAAAVAALVLIDVAALRERAFVGNLGVDRRQIGIVAFATALTLEIAVTAAAGLLG